MIVAKPRSAHPNTLALFGAVAVIVVVSLSIHVVMLQVLWVPYPYPKGLGRLGLLYPLAKSVGLIALAATALPRLNRFHPAVRGPIIGILFATMNGIVRNAIMPGFVTTDFGGAAAGFVQEAMLDLILGTLAVVAVTVIRHTVLRVVTALGLTALSIFILNPTLASLLTPVIAWSEKHTHADVYLVPYGANVLVPSYLLFAETVIACLIARFVVTFRDAMWDQSGLIRYVALVLFFRGTFAMMFGWGPVIGMLSVSQFFLQDLAMAILIDLVWSKVKLGVKS